MTERYPQQCLVCPRWAFDNSCGHFTGPIPTHALPGERVCSCGCGNPVGDS